MAARTTTMTSVKKLAESPNLNHIPSAYVHYKNSGETSASDPDEPIPVIDLSLLTSDNLDVKSRAVGELGRACQEWGFFMVINHGIPETLMKEVIEATSKFFDLSEEEKPVFQPKNVLEPIRYGTSFNTEKEDVFCWRDFLKVFVHPHFHCPDRPQSLRQPMTDYCERTRNIVRKLSKGISESLNLDECEVERDLEFDSSLQIFVGNLYPRCPNPESTLGLTQHSDHCLLTTLIQNGVGGLQIQHKGKWVNVDAVPNSILVNTGDQLEIFSNGKYKSVLHRAVVNGKKTRISIAVANVPSLESVVRPASEVVRKEYGGAASYASVKYRDFMFAQQSSQLNWKSLLKRVEIRE